MFIDYEPDKVCCPDDLITLEELMFRWEYQPIEKITYALHFYGLSNFKIHRLFTAATPSGGIENIVHLTKCVWALDQRSLCYDFNKLVLLKSEVEAVEKDNPLYPAKDETASDVPWYDRCTTKTFRKIAPLLLYVNFKLVGDPADPWKPLFRAHVRNLIESDEIYSPSNCLDAPKKNWILPESAAKSLLRVRTTPSENGLVIDHAYLDEVIAERRAQGIHEDWQLCAALLEYAPNITGISVVKHILGREGKDDAERENLKKKGNRLKEKARKMLALSR